MFSPSRSTGVLLLLVAAVMPCAGCVPRGKQDHLFVGHIAPFSGPLKHLGEEEKQGILFAVEEINQSHALPMGRTLAVLHVDSKDDSDLLQPMAVRLITVNRAIALFAGQNAAEADRVGRAARSHDVPVFTPASVSAGEMADTVFSCNASLEFRAQCLNKFVTNDLKWQRVGVLVDSRDDKYGAYKTRILRDLAITKVEQEYRNENELLKHVEAFRKAGIEQLVHCGTQHDALACTQAGMATIHLAPGGLLLQIINPHKAPLYAASVWAPEIGTELSKELAKKYKEKFKQPLTEPAVLAYESIKAIADLYAKNNPLLASRLRAELDLSTGLTASSKLDKNRTARRPVVMLVCSDGATKEAKRFDPEEPTKPQAAATP